MSADCILITGPVGTGKTSVAWEVSEILEHRGVAHALIDADASYLYPEPPDDPLGQKLSPRILRGTWWELRAVGASRLILTRVVRTRAELGATRAALPGVDMTVIRLTAPLEVVVARIESREAGSGREWHVRQAVQQIEQWDREHVGDYLVDTEGRSVADIAAEIVDIWGM